MWKSRLLHINNMAAKFRSVNQHFYYSFIIIIFIITFTLIITFYSGFQGDWENKLLPALMIQCNMFAAEILFTVCVPLLILYPCTKGVLSGKNTLHTDNINLSPVYGKDIGFKSMTVKKSWSVKILDISLLKEKKNMFLDQ